MSALAADYVRAGSVTTSSSSHRYATGISQKSIVTTSKIFTQRREPCIPEPSQPIPTTEKRGRPGPKARNNVAFNAG
ncbi:hypothetical protein CSO48_003702 [Salmonella enterica subsp. houtenae]|nr:hypothetical protein [Salmonella enterica subsp. houtenae]